MLREEHGIRWQLWRDGRLVACGCVREDGTVFDLLDRFDHVLGLARILAADLHLP